MLLLLLHFKLVFQMLLGLPSAIAFTALHFFWLWTSRWSTFRRRTSEDRVLPCLPRPADRSLPLNHKPSACHHTIGIALSFNMSMPPQSVSSHYIPNCVCSCACSYFSAGLSFLEIHHSIFLSVYQ